MEGSKREICELGWLLRDCSRYGPASSTGYITPSRSLRNSHSQDFPPPIELSVLPEALIAN